LRDTESVSAARNQRVLLYLEACGVKADFYTSRTHHHQRSMEQAQGEL